MDFLALEPLLKARLEEAVTDGGKPIDIASALEPGRGNNKRGRRIEVIYDGYEVVESELGVANVRQFWTVALALDEVRDAAREEARAGAGVILGAIIDALQGWRPAPVDGVRLCHQLQLARPVYRPTYTDQKSFFPLTFSTQWVN